MFFGNKIVFETSSTRRAAHKEGLVIFPLAGFWAFQKYREADKTDWGRPRPQPIKVVAPLIFLAFASHEGKNWDANLIFYWPHVLSAFGPGIFKKRRPRYI